MGMSLALVLAGGGVTGIAWETGVLMGLLDQGIDLVAQADLVIGTSAGSTVGAQVLLGKTVPELYEQQLEETHGEISPRLDLELLGKAFGLMVDGGTRTDEQRRQIGELALSATTVDETTRRAVIQKRIGTDTWPERDLMVTTINAKSGQFVTWDKSSGVSLIDAVASSCAVPTVWPCVTINGERYYDGGLRNGSNAFLAHGHDHIVILAPQTTGPSAAVNQEIEILQDNGAYVAIINTDDEAIAAMGPNSLDPRYRKVSAEHGRRQGRRFTLTL
jgi:NTE family protein